MPDPVSISDFKRSLYNLPMEKLNGDLCVAVSGGPDSMALATLLAEIYPQKNLHAITFNHNLRTEAADEAKTVAGWLSAYPNITHHILEWCDEKPQSRVMEAARAARYKAIADFMLQNGCNVLALGHHQDDQGETFLFRLSKGSGLDGLGGMRPFSDLSGHKGLFLLRPLLDFPKDRLIATCQARNVPFVQDPSNESPHYMRPRLRDAADILGREGLTNTRLARTAARIARASAALEELAERALAEHFKDGCMDMTGLADYPLDIRMRAIKKAIETVKKPDGYGMRTERFEAAYNRLFQSKESVKETIGGCLLSFDPKNGMLSIDHEKR